ncbi:MAG: DUF2764 family protein [Phycisphaerae bacterium]
MPGENYYLLTALPSLGTLGSKPPLSPAELREKVEGAGDATSLVDAMLLADDLLQREALLAGELDEPLPSVLTAAQVRDEQPLPEYLRIELEETSQPLVPADALWAKYFHYVKDLAGRLGSELLADWVGFEVALRNAMVRARAKALDLEATKYIVAPELTDPLADFDALLSDWSNAANPLAAQRVLDTARWKWINFNDRWFSFSNDELVAYTAKLLLLHRWYRVAQAEGEDENQSPASNANDIDERNQP